MRHSNLIGLTGSTGFLGDEVLKQLDRNQVITLGRSENCDFYFDLAGNNHSHDILKIGTLIHCAGLAHYYPRNVAEEQMFEKVNFDGTKDLLKSLDLRVLNRLVFVSTVAVYGREYGDKLNENTETNPITAYGKSKLKTEKFLTEMSALHGFELLIIRLPLIIGKDAPGNLGKMLSAMQKGLYASIDGGKAKRSVVLLQDVAKFIVEQGLTGVFNLTDGCDITFRELEEYIANRYSIRFYIKLPLFFGRILALIGDNIGVVPFDSVKLKLMTQNLTFSCEKAIRLSNWKPQKALENFEL